MSAHSSNETSPLISMSRVCPLCQHRSEHLQLTSDAFTIKEHDIDLRPIYTWKKRVYARYNPELYFILECPACGFCGDLGAFLHPSSQINLTIPYFTKKAVAILTEDRNYRQAAAVLSSPIATDEPGDYLLATRRFLLAILLLEQIPAISQRDSLPLAKYCLHLGWLLNGLSQTMYRKDVLKELLAWETVLHGFWPAVPLLESNALTNALKYYDVCYYNSNCLTGHDSESNILQIMARLNIRLGNFKEAQNTLFKCIKSTNDLILARKKEMGSSATSLEERQNLLTKITELETFAGQCKELLTVVKKYLHPTTPL